MPTRQTNKHDVSNVDSNADKSSNLKEFKSTASLNSRRYYNVKEVADYFSVHQNTVRRLIYDGDIQVIKMRTCVRVSAQELERLEKHFKFDVFK